MTGSERWRRWASAGAFVWVAAGVTGMAAGAGGHALAAQAHPAPTKVEELMAYYIDDGSHWRQDNEDFEPGNGQPEHWVRLVEWGPGRDVAIADAFAVYEDGRCEALNHMIYHWDAGHDRMALASFGAGGMSAAGYAEQLGPSTSRIVVSLTLPNGTTVRFRDTSEHTGQNEYTARGERWVDDAWVPGDMVRWRRVAEESPCG